MWNAVVFFRVDRAATVWDEGCVTNGADQMPFRCNQENATDTTKGHADFSIWDEKGRRVGVVTSRYEFDAVPVTEDDCAWYCLPDHIKAGRVWAGRVWASRDGIGYGATQPYRYFGSAEARDAWIAQQTEATRLRYFRKYVSRAA
jgi:hypothetical protein